MLEKNLVKVRQILDRLSLDDELYMRLYSFATENISGYIDLFDLKNKSLLTVGSSGDQVLNSYLKGCRDITLLDINPFAKYYINLKIAGIISLDYQKFQEFFFRCIGNEFNLKRYNLELFKKMSDNLKIIDYDTYYFFEYVFKNYRPEKISDYLMLDDETNLKVISGINDYLQNETNFMKLKKILKDIRFNFINENFFNFQSSSKYDNIFLSNLCSISNINLYEFRNLLIKLKDNNLNINGSMLVAYLWNTNYFNDTFNYELKPIYNMPGTRLLLKNFITEHHDILGINDILFDNTSKSDLVLVYRKK